MQTTPGTAEEYLLGLTADETRQNHIEITSVSLILKIIALFSQQKIRHTSGSTEELFPEIAINCTLITDALSISCLQDAVNSKEMTSLRLMLINNQSNPSSTSGDPSHFHQESSNSSIYYESALLDSDIDDSGMSVAIESNILSSVDRDVRVVRRKKMTDPPPAYRLQFYTQRYWRHEQIDSNETVFYVPTESSVIDADESESDYDNY